MQLVFYSLILNNHQANVADELWELTGHRYCFVELANMQAEHRKGDTRNYDDCPYLLRAWRSGEEFSRAMELAHTAECCVFSGILALPFQKERMKLGKLSFDMSERWLKKGLLNVFSPTILKMFLTYHLGRWSKKPLYKLCCGAFVAKDQRRLATYRDKCYKWGYFTRVEQSQTGESQNMIASNVVQLMWCSRYLVCKHPELPVLMAARLKKCGYRFVIDMYGSGEYEPMAKQLVYDLNVGDVVHFCGNRPNEELLHNMRKHSIFIFTSDKNEGWGAVANESMANGCVLIASEGIGSVPYLISNGQTGLSFTSPKTSSNFKHPDMAALNDLCKKVIYLLDHPHEVETMRRRSLSLMQSTWSPQIAAERLLVLIDRLQKGADTIYNEGPCSKA